MPRTEQQIQFCENIVAGMRVREAAVAAGFSEATAAVQASQMKKKFGDYIASELIQNIKLGGSEAYLTLLNLMKTAKQDSVKLKAATSILSYGGFEPAIKQEINITSKSDEEIDAQIRGLLGEERAAAILGHSGQTLQ